MRASCRARGILLRVTGLSASRRTRSTRWRDLEFMDGIYGATHWSEHRLPSSALSTLELVPPGSSSPRDARLRDGGTSRAAFADGSAVVLGRRPKPLLLVRLRGALLSELNLEARGAHPLNSESLLPICESAPRALARKSVAPTTTTKSVTNGGSTISYHVSANHRGFLSAEPTGTPRTWPTRSVVDRPRSTHSLWTRPSLRCWGAAASSPLISSRKDLARRGTSRSRRSRRRRLTIEAKRTPAVTRL